MQQFVSQPLRVPALEQGADFARADLIFYGVDHSGPSYTVAIFFDKPRADLTTPLDTEHGYAGSFTVFGHGGCFGAEGHCEVSARHVDAFDHRPPHPLTPLTIAVTVTEAVHRLPDPQVVITLVAVQPGHDGPRPSDAFNFESLRLITYAHYDTASTPS
jgi:tyrosinase